MFVYLDEELVCWPINTLSSFCFMCKRSIAIFNTIYALFSFHQRNCWLMRPNGRMLRRTWELLQNQWEQGFPSPPVCRPSQSQRMSLTSGAQHCRPSQPESSKYGLTGLLYKSMLSLNYNQWHLITRHSFSKFLPCCLFPWQNFTFCFLPRVSGCSDQEIHIWGWLGAEEAR